MTRLERDGGARSHSDAARKRAAVEIVARYEAVLRRTARRYSLDAEDAEDAYQRALEIVLTKAPTTDLRELIRWTQTVTKHEALAVRESRERLLGYRAPSDREGVDPDPLAQIPASADGPDEQVQRREHVARSREALRSLKPAELRALTLLAEGYSYAEISELTGFSPTKVNRVVAEGRHRFRSLLSSSEDGSRCRQLQPLLSAFCDGEASASEASAVREHLRACAHCRATMRAYRAAPRIVAGLVPALAPARSLLERAHDLFAGLASRLPGIGSAGDPPATQIAAAGTAGGAGLAKLLAICVGAAGGTACLATGVVPTPLELLPNRGKPAIERPAEGPVDPSLGEAPRQEATLLPAPKPQQQREPDTKRQAQPQSADTTTEANEATVGGYEASPPPAAAPPPAPAPLGGETAVPSSSSGSAAGEFGP